MGMVRLIFAAVWMSAQPAIAQPAADPHGAAIAEAAERFGIPEQWIRAVMQAESAGDPGATSHAGAVGLMQVMPGTYASLRVRYRLGPDPYAVRDNVMAGAAYLREMHDRYGSPAFLAAYNAGPGRLDEHLRNGRPLPAETRRYLAIVGPRLGMATTVASAPAEAPEAVPDTLFAMRRDRPATLIAVSLDEGGNGLFAIRRSGQAGLPLPSDVQPE